MEERAARLEEMLEQCIPVSMKEGLETVLPCIAIREREDRLAGDSRP